MQNSQNVAVKYLITGGAGFVGSNLVRELLKKPKVQIFLLLKKDTNAWRLTDLLPNPRIHIYQTDLLDTKELKKIIAKIQPSIIYHLAAHGAYPSQNNPEKIFDVNIFGTLNLLQACNRHPYQLFVNIGSSSEYGLKNTAMSETDICHPNTYYAISKLTSTLLCRYAAEKDKKTIVTLRLFSVYGAYEQPSRLIPQMFKSVKNGRPISLAKPNIVHDFIYIEDVISLLLNQSALTKRSGNCFNLGSATQTSLRQLVRTVETITGKKLKTKWNAYPNREWDTYSWVANMTKTRKKLDWKPSYSLQAGLKKNWEWYLKNYHLYE